MTANAWQFTNAARTKFLNGTFDWDTDSLKVCLATSASNIGAASTTYAALTGEVANGNGYTTGGVAVTGTLSGTTTVTADFASDPSWTASGAGIVCRYAVLYEVGGDIIAYSLLDNTPADITVTAGNPLNLTTPSGVFTLA